MSWRDQIVGARMTVDQEFSERVRESEFSGQQWGLIMTAVEFDLEEPGDPEQARLVADTSKIEHVMPQLEKIEQGTPGAGAGGRGGSSGGIVDSLMGMFGLGDGGANDEQRAAAEALAQEYATQLQTHLESKGRWESVRETAADEE